MTPSKMDKLDRLYRQCAEMTRLLCGKCRLPNSCCAPEYCQMAKEYARTVKGVVLKETGHPRLPFMGEQGCTLDPALRPLCALHVCEGTLMREGVKAYTAYMNLRAEISEAEYEAGLLD